MKERLSINHQDKLYFSSGWIYLFLSMPIFQPSIKINWVSVGVQLYYVVFQPAIKVNVVGVGVGFWLAIFQPSIKINWV
jgi:hypothetical protein